MPWMGCRMTWTELFQEDSDIAIEQVKSTLVAEQLLEIAAEMAGIDWCIESLQTKKDSDGRSKDMLDVILGTDAPE